MNKDRRTRLKRAEELLAEVIKIFERVAQEEEDSYLNLPESLQSSGMAYEMQDNYETLGEMVETLGKVKSELLEVYI